MCMMKKAWIVAASAALSLMATIPAAGSTAVGTRQRPEPKVEVIAEDLELSGDYFSEPIRAVGYDAVSISVSLESEGESAVNISILGRNSRSETFFPIYTDTDYGEKFSVSVSTAMSHGYFVANNSGRELTGLRCPEIQVHLHSIYGSSTVSVSLYME